MLILYTCIYACMCLVTQLCPTLCKPMDSSLPSSSIHGDSPSNNTPERLPCPPPGDLSNPGIKPRSSSLQADSLPSGLLGSPVDSMNTGVGSLSLCQGIFPTLESNQGLLHCSWATREAHMHICIYIYIYMYASWVSSFNFFFKSLFWSLFKAWFGRISLVTQWLRIRLAMQEMQVPSLVGKLGSHKPQSNQSPCTVTAEPAHAL